MNSDFKDGYDIMSNIEIFHVAKIQETRDSLIPEQIGLDLLEYSFWTWLGKRYSCHWDIEQDYFEGISGGGGRILTAFDADKETEVFKYNDLKEILSLNQLLPEGHGQFIRIHFPKNTTIEVIQGTKRRVYKIGNKYFRLRIDIYYIGSSGLTYTSLGEKIKKSLRANENEWYSDNFFIKMKCDFSSFRKGSPHLKDQRDWIIDIMDGIEHDFDWSNLKPELEKAYN
jgi:hypothetical protein